MLRLAVALRVALAANCQGEGCEDVGLLHLKTSSRIGPWSFGGIVPGDPLYHNLEGSEMPKPVLGRRPPREFDARTAWPHCRDVVDHIRDQSMCGSCWAVGSIATLNDRLCIIKGDTKTILSAKDPLANCNSTIPGSVLPTCVHPGLGGCGGGQLEFVWKWYTEVGAVSGAGYLHHGFDGKPDDTCAPYPFPPCHDPAWSHSPACQHEEATPDAFSSCAKNFQEGYMQDKIKATRWYKVPPDAIQDEIMRFGTVSCQVRATCSMGSYTGGVYVPSGRVCGGHVMRIVGWGVEAGQKYWWVANSWGKDWGLGGYIKWIRGEDGGGIESGVVAGLL